MKVLKYSRQREAIKASLMNRCDHPTADALYASIREEFPNISLGTVYRNLNLLVETGEIRKLSCGSGADHYDGDELNAAVQSHAPGHIDSHSILFFGQCQSCMDMENPKKDQKTIDKTA